MEIGKEPAANVSPSTIAHAILGDAFLSQEALAKGNFPRQVLAPIVEGLAYLISKHHHPGCHHIPRKVRMLGNMSLRALKFPHAVRALEQVILEEREHDMVVEITEMWLEQHQELAELCDASREVDLLQRIAYSDAKELAEVVTTLWAARIDEEDAREWILRVAISLFTIRSETTKTSPAPGGERKELQTGKDDGETSHRAKELLRDNRRLREESKEARRAQRHAQEAADSAREKVLEIEEAAADFERAANEKATELETLRPRTAQLTRDLNRQNERATRFERAHTASTEDIQVLRRELKQAEEARATMTTDLAQLRASLLTAQAELERLEDGAVLAFTFIQKELTDAKEKSAIAQGGMKPRAEERKRMLKKLLDLFVEVYPAHRPSAPILVRKKQPLRFEALGGYHEVGATCYVLEIAERRILIDCGIRVGRETFEEMAPDIDRLPGRRLDAVILTHAHSDHMGWLPALARRMDFQLFATPSTNQLLPIMLKDGQKQVRRLIAKRRELVMGGLAAENLNEPYRARDVEDVLARRQSTEIGKQILIGEDLSFTFFQAGHILGAVSVLIEGGGRSVFFTSDFADFAQRTVPAAHWPTYVQMPELVVMESTYGAGIHEDRSEEPERLAQEVARIVQADGTVLIPCFALGRAQEVITILSEAMASQAIPEFPIWIDGMIQDVNEVYRAHESLETHSSCKELRRAGETTALVIEKAKVNPCAIVSTSGMVTGGPMVEYASALLPNPNNRIFICGYQDEYSPGSQLLKLGHSGSPHRQISLTGEDGKQKSVRVASIPKRFNLSAHADQAGLVAAAERFGESQVCLVHGEEPARIALEQELRSRGISVASSPFQLAD